MDELIGWLASQQHGRVARWQLLHLGVDRRMIDRRVADGRLRPVHPGVFAVAHSAELRFGRTAAAVLACGADGFAAQRTAGWLQDLLHVPSRLEVAVRDRSPHVLADVRVRRPTDLRDDEVHVVHGIPCTTVARTLVDVAAVVRLEQLAYAVGQAERAGTLDLVAIGAVLDHLARPRGVRNLRAALAAPAPLLRSRLEQRFLGLCGTFDLPVPRMNHHVEVGPGDWREVDAVWPAERVAVEVDGEGVHTGYVAAQADASKQAALEAVGFAVVRCPELDLVLRGAKVAGTVRAALLARRGTS